MVYPLSDKRWRDTLRRRSPLGVPVLVAEEDQAGQEAASSTWCGRQYSPFRAESQTAWGLFGIAEHVELNMLTFALNRSLRSGKTPASPTILTS